MITQSKIAELAGVSRSTVERVLNNRGDVNEDTRKRILEIAKKFDYQPNRAGQTLVIRQKNITIGCIIIEADNPFYAELNKGIEAKAKEFATYGIKVIVRKAPFAAEAQIKEIDYLLGQDINALVIQPIVNAPVTEKLKALEEKGIPVVTMNTDIPNHDSQFCYVGNDFYLCGKTAANLMTMFTGAQCNVGIITGFANAKSHYDRIDGFKDYIKDYPNMKIVDVAENQDDDLESYHITKKMIEEHPDIDAMFIVAGGVNGAGKAIKSFKDREIRTISFDDMPETRKLVKDGTILATICQQPIRQGELALAVLFDYFVDGKKPENNRIYTDIQIKVKANIDQ